ncbi:MAG TPA: hypothetical protein VNL18_15480 [Gemmatimonadales bacterium]|nr:hypothetical protein [Gemmatimonadales bacterium]
MSDLETRDAYLGVEVALPNGATVRGKPIPYGEAVRLMALADEWASGGDPKTTLLELLESFHRLSGITREEIMRRDPDLTLGDMMGVITSFFFQPSRGRAAETPSAGATGVPEPRGA